MALTKEQAAKAAILAEMHKRGWPRHPPEPHVIDGMVRVLDGSSIEAVANAAREFATGALDRDHTWPPTGAELAARARIWQSAIDQRDGGAPERLVSYPMGELPPAGHAPAGIVNVDFGRGKVTMIGLSGEEQARVLAAKGETPDGRSLAYLPASEIRKALAGDLLNPPVPMPKLQRIG